MTICRLVHSAMTATLLSALVRRGPAVSRRRFPVLRTSSSPLTPVPSVEPDRDTAVGCCFSGHIHGRGGRGQAGTHGAYDRRRVDAGGVQQLGRLSGLWRVGYVARRQPQDRRAMRLIGESAQHGFAKATLGPVILDGDDHAVCLAAARSASASIGLIE